jgi:outer membrane protein insertion porin family
MRIIVTGILVALIAVLLAQGSSTAEEIRRKWMVESVEVEGNEAFGDDEIRSVMVTRPSGWFSSNEFRPSIFREDLSNVVDFYRQHGYLDAAVIDTSVVRDSSDYDVDITLTIDEGSVTLVEAISFFGNETFSDSILLDLVELEPGSPFNRRALQNGMMAIATFYADRGYLDASVTPQSKINKEVYRVLIDLNVKEGRQMVISDIEIEGLIKTKPFVVRRELLFEQSEVVSYSKLMESQRRLYLTGLFRGVRIEPVKRPADTTAQRTILVQVDESLNSMFSVSAGYGSVEQVMGEVELSTSNLAGTARKLGGRVEANFIERRVESSFSEPRSFGTRFTTDLNLFYSFQDEPGYDVSRYGGHLSIGRKIGRSGHVMLRYRHENQRLTHIDTAEPPEELDPRIRSITLAFSRDTRDRLFNPSRGLLVDVSYELAGAFFQGTDSFTRAVAGARWFYPLRRNTIFATSIEGGWVDVFGREGGIPLNELFYTGGPNSIRGFEYQKVGPLDVQDEPIGGQLELIWNIEIRQGVWRWIGLVAFADVGNVWSKVRYYKFSTVRYAVGPGLRVNTPIGIVRLDVGFNPDQREGEDSYRLQLGMGHAF